MILTKYYKETVIIYYSYFQFMIVTQLHNLVQFNNFCEDNLNYILQPLSNSNLFYKLSYFPKALVTLNDV